MKIAFFKSRCIVCWKGFDVPSLSEISSGDNLYYDKTSKTFSLFKWFDNREIESCITDFLSKKTELQLLNDETKGNTTRKIIGRIADGDKECVFGFNRCPRCGIKFNSVSDTKTEVKEIGHLSFTDFLKLDHIGRQQYLQDRTKNGL